MCIISFSIFQWKSNITFDELVELNNKNKSKNMFAPFVKESFYHYFFILIIYCPKALFKYCIVGELLRDNPTFLPQRKRQGWTCNNLNNVMHYNRTSFCKYNDGFDCWYFVRMVTVRPLFCLYFGPYV